MYVATEKNIFDKTKASTLRIARSSLLFVEAGFGKAKNGEGKTRIK